MTPHRICDDPIERIVQIALERADIVYVLEGECPDAGQTLDFWLPHYDVYIECKQFHTPRIADQMSRAPNIIAIQGRPAAELFAAAIGALCHPSPIGRGTGLKIPTGLGSNPRGGTNSIMGGSKP
jgi:hypothetical protein